MALLVDPPQRDNAAGRPADEPPGAPDATTATLPLPVLDEPEPQATDHVVDAFGLRVLVDPKSAPIVAGSTLEFNDALLGGGFKINNPQAVHECACGESFAI